MQLHDASRRVLFGAALPQARGAVILVHGRGSSAEAMEGLGEVFGRSDLALIAPSATRGTWYPQRFLAPLAENEPWLSSALGVLDHWVKEIEASGLDADRIGLIGFSQGACLALEYAMRHPRRYAFIGGLSGGLIGPLDTPRSAADLQGTPVLLGCAERDAHIPLAYVERSAEVFAAAGGEVTKLIFPGEAHTVFPEEVVWLKQKASAHLPA